MGSDKFMQSLFQSGFLSEDDLINTIAARVSTLSMQRYDAFISLCKKHHIDDNDDFFMKIYINAPESIQYRLWKDGYVNSCPANYLIDAIVSENLETLQLINHDYDVELQNCEAHFNKIQDVIVNRISKAQESINVAMAWFTNPIIFNALLRACRRGVEVQLLINNDLINNRPNGLPFNKLIECGASLYIAEPPTLIHNKFCIIDKRIVIDGSYNWTILAETNNDENIVIIENGSIIQSFIDAFERLIQKNELIDHMPARIPERPEFDCCSYKYFNSKEYLAQIDTTRGEKKQRMLYKEIFKLMPEDYTEEVLPSDIFDEIKSEVEKEKVKDTILLNSSLNQQTEQLQKKLQKNERAIENITHKTEILEEKKAKVKDDYKSKVSSIKTRKISQQKKNILLTELRTTQRAKLSRINRTIAKHGSQLNSLREESDAITVQQEFIDSIKDTELKGNNGLCRINLRWNTEDDLDLHLILPNGKIDTIDDIYYQNMRVEYNNGICTLDHDAIPTNAGENPQENIVWENSLPDGKYKVVVKLFNKKSSNDKIPFSVSTFTGKYVNTELFSFKNASSYDIIEITTLTFKNGRVITPIVFNTKKSL